MFFFFFFNFCKLQPIHSILDTFPIPSSEGTHHFVNYTLALAIYLYKGLNHVLLQLLIFNTPGKELRVEIRSEVLYAQGGPSLVTRVVKNPPAMKETWVRSLGWEEDPLEEGMATYSSILT